MKSGQLNKKSLWLIMLVMGAPILSSCLIQIYSLPAILRLSPGQNFTISAYFPLNFSTMDKHLESLFPVESSQLLTKNIILHSKSNQEFDIQIRLFGAIPIKKLHVQIAKPPLIIPGGQAIGVLFSSKGVIIVGDLPLKGVDGKTYCPAREAGIKIGDIMLAINGFPVNRVEEVEYHLRKYQPEKKYLLLSIRRKNKLLNLKIKPVLTSNGSDEKRFMLGIYIEDPAAGVGTLTFYDPNSKRFAGLGHRISEFAGRTKIPFQQGEIVMAKISGIKPGIPGQPGEKIGIFNSNVNPIGKIEKNCRFGIYGTLYQGLAGITPTPIPTAYGSEIKIGPAQIYTVINGSKVEHYKVKIIRVYRQDKPRDKGMVIKVVDPLLLKMTGGIIQGMSGSPIIQNGKFVGAVTHVLVNDPTKGYGVLAEWMIKEINKAAS